MSEKDELRDRTDAGAGDSPFPQTIWILWLQGWDKAPEVVKRCLRSWQHHNLGWTIRALDAETLPLWVDLSDFSPMETYTAQALSDIVRLSLLKTHGGVWVDATSFCRRPLDEWLFLHLDSGFFSFERQGGPVGFFLAATPGNRAVDIWWREIRAYWIGCSPQLRTSLKNQRYIDRLNERAFDLGRDRLRPSRAIDYPLRILGRWIARHPEIYRSYLFRNVLMVAPYYWLAIHFHYCYKKHPDLRRIWDRTPKMRASGRLELGGLPALYAPLSEDTRRSIDGGFMPVYVLYRQLDLTKAGPGTFLGHLLATIPGSPTTRHSESVVRNPSTTESFSGGR